MLHRDGRTTLLPQEHPVHDLSSRRTYVRAARRRPSRAATRRRRVRWQRGELHLGRLEAKHRL
eukprot:6080110-Prymnesium_polylepis.1